jgi:hypothetical protein
MAGLNQLKGPEISYVCIMPHVIDHCLPDCIIVIRESVRTP